MTKTMTDKIPYIKKIAVAYENIFRTLDKQIKKIQTLLADDSQPLVKASSMSTSELEKRIYNKVRLLSYNSSNKYYNLNEQYNKLINNTRINDDEPNDDIYSSAIKTFGVGVHHILTEFDYDVFLRNLNHEEFEKVLKSLTNFIKSIFAKDVSLGIEKKQKYHSIIVVLAITFLKNYTMTLESFENNPLTNEWRKSIRNMISPGQPEDIHQLLNNENFINDVSITVLEKNNYFNLYEKQYGSLEVLLQNHINIKTFGESGFYDLLLLGDLTYKNYFKLIFESMKYIDDTRKQKNTNLYKPVFFPIQTPYSIIQEGNTEIIRSNLCLVLLYEHAIPKYSYIRKCLIIHLLSDYVQTKQIQITLLAFKWLEERVEREFISMYNFVQEFRNIALYELLMTRLNSFETSIYFIYTLYKSINQVMMDKISLFDTTGFKELMGKYRDYLVKSIKESQLPQLPWEKELDWVNKTYPPQPQPQPQPPASSGGKNTDKIHILGRTRKIYKQGRRKMVRYQGELISLTLAKKLAR